MRRLLAVLALAAALPPARGAEVKGPDLPGTGCDPCKGKGWQPCPHDWESLKGANDPVKPGPGELDVGPLKVGGFECSACLELACCRGVGWKPCPKCAPAGAKTAWDAAVQARRDFLKGRQEVVDSRLKSSPIHIRTEHFELVSELKPDRVDVYQDPRDRTYRDGFLHEEIVPLQLRKRGAALSAHMRAHLYARRLEECWELFAKSFDPDGSNPLWPPLDHDATTSYTPLQGTRIKRDKQDWSQIPAGHQIRQWIFLLGPVKGSVEGIIANDKIDKVRTPVGGSYFFDIAGSPKSRKFAADVSFHQYLYHNVSELLVHDYVISGSDYSRARANAKRTDWRTPSLDLPDWIHEGWARVQEMDKFGDSKVHCYAEVVNEDFQAGKRREYVRDLKKLLEAERLVPFPELSRLHTDKFNAKIHKQIWFILDSLRRLDPAKFPKLVAATKLRACELNDSREGFVRALEEVYNLTPMGLEEAWKADLKKQRE